MVLIVAGSGFDDEWTKEGAGETEMEKNMKRNIWVGWGGVGGGSPDGISDIV